MCDRMSGTRHGTAVPVAAGGALAVPLTGTGGFRSPRYAIAASPDSTRVYVGLIDNSGS